MQILFLHSNFPAQFRHLAAALAADPNNHVVFGTNRQEGQLPKVQKVVYDLARQPNPDTHRYIAPMERAVLEGQAVYRVCQDLKREGFYPDVIYGHSGWGTTLFMKDLFPKATLLGYFEWFYHAHGTDVGFDPAETVTADDEARIRIKNAPILLDLHHCDRGLCPTRWQYRQFPADYHAKLTVLHDGVDTTFFQPQPGARLVLSQLGLDLSQASEIVTYVARGMEPYRGFPQLIQTIALLQERRPQCHVVIVGDDRTAYGKTRTDGKTHKEHWLETVTLDLSRVHFTGRLPYPDYLKVLQASSVHVYLTYPFVLSWSMLEAMATGCLLVASDTPPVTEVIQDGVNGLLVDFFSPEQIADRVIEALEGGGSMVTLRHQARQTIQQRYNLQTLLTRQLHWLQPRLDRLC